MDLNRVKVFVQKALDEGRAHVTPDGTLVPQVHVYHEDGCPAFRNGECLCEPELSFEDRDNDVSAFQVVHTKLRDPIDSN